MATRPQHHSQGYTLIEMFAVIGIVSVVAAFAMPSFLSLNKPLRYGVSQFKGQLSLVRLKAISSSQAYRIRPKFATLAEYPFFDQNDTRRIARNFIVERAVNCQATTGWEVASQFDLDLPKDVGLDLSGNASLPPGDTIVPIQSPTASLTWNLCFDNRGIVDKNDFSILLKDYQGNNKGQLAWFRITKVGGTIITTYDRNNLLLNEGGTSQGNPIF